MGMGWEWEWLVGNGSEQFCVSFPFICSGRVTDTLSLLSQQVRAIARIGHTIETLAGRVRVTMHFTIVLTSAFGE